MPVDADRFHSDVAGEELQLRQDRYHRSQQIYENKRVAAAEKEEDRWRKIEDTKAAEEAYWHAQRESGVKVIVFLKSCFLHLAQTTPVLQFR